MFISRGVLPGLLIAPVAFSSCCGFGYPPGRVEVKKVRGAYDVIFSADCSSRGSLGSVSIHEVLVTELPTERVVCWLKGGPIRDWWRYGEDASGMSFVTKSCAPLKVGGKYQIHARGWVVVVIEPSGEPRVVDASCEELIGS